MSDLVNRLRKGDQDRGTTCWACGEAAARIEALEAALRAIWLQNMEPYAREIASAALAPEQDK